MKTKMILVVAVIAIAVIAGIALALFFTRGFGAGRFPGDRFPGFNGTQPPGGNITLNESAINEVTRVFDNAGTTEEITEYCGGHVMECGYYCRNINLDHEFCSSFRGMRNDLRNISGGVLI
jgi:hypothetical protein